jgi:hypothetical protein
MISTLFVLSFTILLVATLEYTWPVKDAIKRFK